ncbi:protein kinase, partial [Penicillium daleae]
YTIVLQYLYYGQSTLIPGCALDLGRRDLLRLRVVDIYRAFSEHSSCPSIVQCFYLSDNGIFLEYMRDKSLSSRIQNNHIRNQETMVVTKVEKIEPLSLRLEWMKDLAQGVAFLESLNFAHGDLRPENILLDRN